MKYLITESRLDEMIDDYITNITGGVLELHKHPNAMFDYVWWTDLEGRSIFEGYNNNEGLSLGVREDIWNSVNRMFSLSSNNTDIAFLKWMFNYNGMKFPSGVYTFENEY
jgi:hypothetical protein